MGELKQAIEQIEAATSSALFGTAPEQEYKRLLKLCHPDRLVGSPLRDRAAKAMNRLLELYKTIGDPKPAGFTPTKIGEWVTTANFSIGHICDLFVAEKDIPRSDHSQGIMKLPRDPRDNDLIEREYNALKRLQRSKPEEFHVYLPSLLSHFKAGGHKINVFAWEHDCFTLDQIKDRIGLLDFRHIVWMGNRLWSVLGFAHHNCVIHGAVLPEHLLYRPTDHGLKLVDWCYSVTATDQHIPAIVTGRSHFYPKEVARKRCDFSTDIYMASQCLRSAANEIPKRFRAFFDWTLAESPASRPSDAWDVQDRWKALAEAEYGKPQFLTLEIPIQ